MKQICLGLAVFSLVAMTACNDPADRAAKLQTRLQTEVQESDSFSLNPQGPTVADISYDSSEETKSCTLTFSVSSTLPEAFFQTTDSTLTKNSVLDACIAQLSASKDLGRLYFSKNAPAPSSTPPSHHSATSMSEFLHAVVGLESTGDAQALLACMSSGLNDYFTRASSAHGRSESGYQSQETSDSVHVHYDLTVYGITSYVSQLVKIVEVNGVTNQVFVVFATGTDGDAADAENYSHTGVKVNCQ